MHFVAKRPFSVGLFVGLMTSMSFYEGAPVIWILAITVVVGTSFARIIGSLIEASWKRHFVYGLVTFLVMVRLLDAINLPLPLFRLYMLLAALAGLSLCICWAVGTFRRGDSLMYTWGLILGSIFLVLVLIAELWGKSGLTDYLFRSSVRTILSVFAGWLLMYLVGGGIEWIFHSSPIQRVTVVHDNTTAFVRRLTLLMDVLIGTLILSTILVIWRMYDTPAYAIKSLLSAGFTLGSQRISVGLLVTAGVILYASFLTSWAVQKMFVEGVLTKRHVGIGVKSSIARLIHYALISIGFFLALIAIGFELTKLTIIVSALGIGIGFGLQNIVSNFICGIILLFERPVRVGDYIDIGENLAVIKRIGLRSTTVQTFDRADVIIPNTDLITTKVTNLTLTDRYVRVIIRVRVEYGSDVSLVIDTLKKCAKTNSKVLEVPKLQVLFRKFGDYSLDFELRFCIANVDNKLQVESDLYQEIDREFRQSGIEIALPPFMQASSKETGEERQ
jgi:small-conductance mechanosensitive channel